jgi:hypothetical protein
VAAGATLTVTVVGAPSGTGLAETDSVVEVGNLGDGRSRHYEQIEAGHGKAH